MIIANPNEENGTVMCRQTIVIKQFFRRKIVEKKYTLELLDYMVKTGKRLLGEQGNIQDIGVKKQWLTEEDIRIEREIVQIIKKIPGEHKFFAEEEHQNFVDADSIWVIDPISGTKLFIEGKQNYAIVASHVSKGKVDFAAVYNPSSDKLYVADEEGVTINGKKLKRNQKYKKKIIFSPSYAWKDKEQLIHIEERLKQNYDVFPSQGSFAVNYCLVAEGEYDGVVSLTKDAFPEFAGCFIANSAEKGICATNILGNKDISPNDRAFVCGSKENYQDLFSILSEELGLSQKNL